MNQSALREGGLGAVGTRVHYAKRVILTLLSLITGQKYIYGFANLMLSLWCHSLKNKSSLLQTHAQVHKRQSRLHVR